jgi:protein-S-isoprenylcysteine O-methyltransferase Ste14
MLIAALNEMIDVVTTRESMREATIPNTILWLLLVLSFLSSIVIGYCTESRLLDSIIAQAFTVVVCLTVFIILDLDRPRRGFITLQKEEKHLTALMSDLAD